MNSMYALIYGKEAVKLASERGIIGAAKISLHAEIGDEEFVVGTTVVWNSGITDRTGLQRKSLGDFLQCSADSEMVVIRGTERITEFQTVEYQYTSKNKDEEPEKLAHVVPPGICT